MLTFVKGTLFQKEADRVIVEVGGLGYCVRIGLNSVHHLGDCGGEVMLYTYLLVREDDVQLYGFLKHQELEMFRLLIAVSGVGPKSALSLIDSLPGEQLCRAIAEERAVLLTGVPGIGKKTAQRLIIDLKDKVSKVSAGYSHSELSVMSGDGWDEALQGLLALGYSKEEARKLLDLAGKELGLEATAQRILQFALKQAGT